MSVRGVPPASRSRALRLLGCAGALVLVTAACSAQDESLPEELAEDAALDDDSPVVALDQAAPGDLVELVEGVTAVVPEPGDGVTMEILYEGGDAFVVDVTTTLDEEVLVTIPGLGFAADLDPQAACPSKCNHKAYNLLGFHWDKRLRWRYRDAHRPGSVGRKATIGALRYAASTITRSRNACNMDDRVSARHEYLGQTSVAPNIEAGGGTVSCKANDGKNVVGWAPNMPASVLGVTCTWRSSGIAVESDQKYAANGTKWFAANSKPDSCSNRYSLRAVAAHEFGHAFGLGHTGCNQTMAPFIPPCQTHRRRLGRGDVKGLRQLY